VTIRPRPPTPAGAGNGREGPQVPRGGVSGGIRESDVLRQVLEALRLFGVGGEG
jgi:hypothetical protein